MSAFFVTGTDTGVGKTVVSCAIAAALCRRGMRVSVMKPCETGEGDDAEQLIAASGHPHNLKWVRPYAFRLPASPEVAAAHEGKSIELAPIVDAFHALSRDADVTLVEGAGGLLVPIAPSFLMADLARALSLPIVIVARPSLGTVNHTLLTIEAARARGLTILGVVFSRRAHAAGPDEETNPEAIRIHGQVQILGTLPSVREPGNIVELADAAAQLDLEKLIHRRPR